MLQHGVGTCPIDEFNRRVRGISRRYVPRSVAGSASKYYRDGVAEPFEEELDVSRLLYMLPSWGFAPFCYVFGSNVGLALRQEAAFTRAVAKQTPPDPAYSKVRRHKRSV